MENAYDALKPQLEEIARSLEGKAFTDGNEQLQYQGLQQGGFVFRTSEGKTITYELRELQRLKPYVKPLAPELQKLVDFLTTPEGQERLDKIIKDIQASSNESDRTRRAADAEMRRKHNLPDLIGACT